jgi:hypothetical protein
MYLVRWVGDWPEDQNPTWEPKANIPDWLRYQYEEEQAAAKDPEFDPENPLV